MKAYCTQNTGDCRTCSLSSYGRDCRNNRIEEPTGAKLTEDTFRTYMNAVKVLETADYLAGYQYGLRRCWHGARFGEDEQIERMRARGGDMAAGVVDGLAGIAPRGMRGEGSANWPTLLWPIAPRGG